MSIGINCDNINSLIDLRVSQDPDALFFRGGKHLSYSEMKDESQKLAAYLTSWGVTKGSHVALVYENEEGFIITMFAIIRCGAVAVLMSPQWNPDTVAQMYEMTKCEYICIAKEKIDIIKGRSEFADCRKVFPYCTKNGLCLESDDFRRDIDFPECSGDDAAFILFTSGTTSGKNKAIVYDHGSVICSSYHAKELFRADPRDVFCVAIPGFHCFCLLDNVIAALCAGAEIACVPKTDRCSILKTIADNKCTIFNAVPSIFHKLVSFDELPQYDIKSLRTGVIAGAPYSRKLFREIEEKLDMTLLASLGLTETCGAISQTELSESFEIRSSTWGKILPHVECRIDAEDGSADGEICVRGKGIIKAYYANAADTAESIDEEGWFHTGDVGHLDPDGYLYLSGRKKNLIIRNGENISPAELEEIAEGFEGVEQCVALGVPSEHYGEDICLCLKSEENKKLDISSFKKYFADRVERNKVPLFYMVYDDFPMTTTGKIDIKKLNVDVNLHIHK